MNRLPDLTRRLQLNFMISHDVHASLSVAKHVLKIGRREALFFGTPQEYELSEEGTL